MATIEKRNNAYRIIVSCGIDTNGRQIRKRMTWTPEKGMTAKQIEKEVQIQAALFEERCRTGVTLDSNMRFKDFSEMWIEDRKKDLKPKTLARYRGMLPRINAAIGHLQLDKIQPLHLRQFYANLSEGGIRADTKYKLNIDFNEYLKSNKLSGAAVSKASGLPTTTITAFKKGSNVSYESALKMCEYMKKPIGELFTPIGSDKPLSSKTVLHHHRLISSMLSSAVEWGILFSNPCDRTKAPRVEKKDPRYLDEEQVAMLFALLDNESFDYRIMIRLLVFTGLRRGEMLGLEWKDIDFKNRIMTIKRESLYLPDLGIYDDTTKTESSDRVFKVSQTVIDDLKEYKIWHLEQRLRMGDRWHESDRLFTTSEGLPFNPDTLSSWFSDFMKAHSDVLPYVSIHSLRHTNTTLQIAAGVPITTVAMRLGHANPTTTAKIYAHAIRSADEAAADSLEDILAPTKKAARKRKNG